MKALILSDIHSNIYALEAIWKYEHDSDHVYCAGDLVDYGPNPKEVLDWIRENGVICTQGNHDRWLVNVYQSNQHKDIVASKERYWIHHNAELLNDEDVQFLSNLPLTHSFQADKLEFGMTHLYRGYEEITNLHAFYRFQKNKFNKIHFSHLILGHTHRQCIHYLSDEVLWMNPGSVSYRRHDDPDQTAQYAVIKDGKISLKKIPYDLKPLQDSILGIELVDSEKRATERFFGRHSS